MKKYVAEFIGTFVLVFVSCGAAAVPGGIGGVLGVAGIALAFGLLLTSQTFPTQTHNATSYYTKSGGVSSSRLAF